MILPIDSLAISIFDLPSTNPTMLPESSKISSIWVNFVCGAIVVFVGVTVSFESAGEVEFVSGDKRIALGETDFVMVQPLSIMAVEMMAESNNNFLFIKTIVDDLSAVL